MKRKPNRAKGPFDPMKQMRFDFEYAKHCITTDGYVLPVFIVHMDGHMLPVGWGPQKYDDDGRRVHRRIASLLCIAHDAHAVAYIGEAWMAWSLPDEPEPAYPRVRPKDRDDRHEIILTQMLWREGDGLLAAMIQAEIVRNDKGDCVGLRNEETSGPTDVIIGNFSEILPHSRPMPEHREIAMKMLEEIKETGMLRSVSPPTMH